MVVILTRSEPGAHKTAAFLRENGVTSVECYPLLAFSLLAPDIFTGPESAPPPPTFCPPRHQAPIQIDAAITDLIFTSANGVRACTQLGLEADARPVWCVGEATAAAAAKARWQNINTSRGDGAALAHYILDHIGPDTGRSFVHFANLAAAHDLVEILQSAGISARRTPIYQMIAQPIGPLLTRLQRNGPGEAIVVFHSAMAARIWAEASQTRTDIGPLAYKVIAFSEQVETALGGVRPNVQILPAPNDMALLPLLQFG